jgi:hypothetical protein
MPLHQSGYVLRRHALKIFGDVSVRHAACIAHPADIFAP